MELKDAQGPTANSAMNIQMKIPDGLKKENTTSGGAGLATMTRCAGDMLHVVLDYYNSHLIRYEASFTTLKEDVMRFMQWTIMLGILGANIHWQLTPNYYLAGVLAWFGAYSATLAVDKLATLLRGLGRG